MELAKEEDEGSTLQLVKSRDVSSASIYPRKWVTSGGHVSHWERVNPLLTYHGSGFHRMKRLHLDR
jgi:hypothetical protein